MQTSTSDKLPFLPEPSLNLPEEKISLLPLEPNPPEHTIAPHTIESELKFLALGLGWNYPHDPSPGCIHQSLGFLDTTCKQFLNKS